ncbi:MAG: hypothetical protein QG590_1857, partial [Pseudomonadota bacterium]|nr:hypothetical protein [Pseudomonadota bacterium]
MDIKQLLTGRRALITAGLACAGVVVAMLAAGGKSPVESAANPSPARPALSVSMVVPQREEWPQTLAANGNVVAWQEAVIGPEISNYRITEVRVQVGD